ncbi:MAG: hypothetical protein IPO67_19785 [Deltaproteobacteria bacterium]|nr:hypothetical protein [Deltaproteobacteria bacterium]
MRTPNDRVVRLTLTLVGFFGTLSFAQTVWATKCVLNYPSNTAELLRLTVKVDGENVPEEDPLALGWATMGELEYVELSKKDPTDDDPPPKPTFQSSMSQPRRP